MSTQRIVVLLSGRGSNLQAIVERARAERWPAEVVAVIANRPTAGGLALAQALGITTLVVDHRGFDSREAFDAALADVIDAHAPDLVLLAGFMRILSNGFVQRYSGRLLNIHPSLLPAFAGLNTHQRALDAGCKLAGATVHLVTPTLDHGPILAQVMVPVRPDDTAQSLSDRVLAGEHRLYPLVVGWWVRGELVVEGDQVRHAGGASQLLVCD